MENVVDESVRGAPITAACKPECREVEGAAVVVAQGVGGKLVFGATGGGTGVDVCVCVKPIGNGEDDYLSSKVLGFLCNRLSHVGASASCHFKLLKK